MGKGQDAQRSHVRACALRSSRTQAKTEAQEHPLRCSGGTPDRALAIPLRRCLTVSWARCSAVLWALDLNSAHASFSKPRMPRAPWTLCLCDSASLRCRGHQVPCLLNRLVLLLLRPSRLALRQPRPSPRRPRRRAPVWPPRLKTRQTVPRPSGFRREQVSAEAGWAKAAQSLT